MFLNPTAKPSPRRTPSPRVVLPAPPGSRIASRGSASGSGGDIAAARRMTSLVGSEPVRSCPVGSAPPGSSAFRSRSSTGSISSSPASLSICASAAKQDCTAPNPRIAPQGGLFVYTHVPSISTFSTAYGPTANEHALEITAVELDPRPDRDELPLLRGAMLRPDAGRVPVDVAYERLLPVVDHLHGAARAEREERGVHLDREVLPPTERAPDAREVHPHHL